MLTAEIQMLLEPECTVAETAELLGISQQSVTRAIERGTLPARDAAIQLSDRRDWRCPLNCLLKIRNDYTLRKGV
jgi:hypothetical protein